MTFKCFNCYLRLNTKTTSTTLISFLVIVNCFSQTKWAAEKANNWYQYIMTMILIVITFVITLYLNLFYEKTVRQ